MNKKTYDKLVRDNIPSIIAQAGKNCRWRLATKEEAPKYLLAKIKEEAQELSNATTKEEATNEIADILEVVSYIASLFGIDKDEIDEVVIAKHQERGGFDNLIILEEVE